MPLCSEPRSYSRRLKSFGEWLRAGRLTLGWTQANVAERVGASAAAVASWERGAFEPSHEHFTKLAELFPLTIAETEASDFSPSFTTTFDLASTTIPVLGYVSAGTPREAWEIPLGQISMWEYDVLGDETGLQGFYDGARRPGDDPAFYGLVVSGESLRGDGIHDGDVLIVDREDKGLTIGKIYACRLPDGEITVKHVDIDAAKRVILKASNDDYPDLTTDEVDVQGRVVRHYPRPQIL